MFSLQSKKEYINPYRHGVLIGNFVEDIIGQDLVSKYKTEKPYTNYKSEFSDRFTDPKAAKNNKDLCPKAQSVKAFYDVNIDFSKKTLKDIQEQILIKQNSKIEPKSQTQRESDPFSSTQREKVLSRLDVKDDIKSEIGPQVEDFTKKDLIGIYYTTKSGLKNSLLKGHGPNQHNFSYNEYISVKK